MNKLKIMLIFFVIIPLIYACNKSNGSGNIKPQKDTFSVIVNNGYGSGNYKAGDTVNIFSENYNEHQLFDQWSGDVTLLNAPHEWHTWFIMPERDVLFTGHIKSGIDFSLQLKQIRGRDRMKPVYYYFPADHKGIIYLLHGTGGNATHLVKDYEWLQLIKRLVSDHFAVIITEAEESTTNTDTNGDGKIRWTMLPYDTSSNVDYANIRIITDYFYKNGMANSSEPKYCIGMSDGGFFGAALSSIYHFKACVNYCSQGSDAIIKITTTPIQFCMARFDSNAQVGSEGNAAALANSNALNERGICSKFLIKERSPLYSQRFARSGDLSMDQSVEIFNELKSNGFLDSKDYFLGTAGDLISDYQNDPGSFPVLNSLSLEQQIFVKAQVALSVSDHRMYSDFDAATLQFLNTQCN